ncbi:uncharacterized protein V6R79_016893 [Siganus canaliculatus]
MRSENDALTTAGGGRRSSASLKTSSGGSRRLLSSSPPKKNLCALSVYRRARADLRGGGDDGRNPVRCSFDSSGVHVFRRFVYIINPPIVPVDPPRSGGRGL